MTLTVGGMTRMVDVTFTRPADGTAYATKDVVTDSSTSLQVLTFSDISRDFKTSGYITGALISCDQKSNTARFRLHLFNTAPTAIADNSPYLTLYANKATKVGVIDFPAMTTEDATNSTQSYSQNTTIRLPYITASGDTALYGIVETLDAFTPATSGSFYVRLISEQN